MRDPRRSAPPGTQERGRLARLLIVALGVLGFVVVPAAGAASAAAGAGSGVRAGAAQAGPSATVRARTSKPRGEHAEITAQVVAQQQAVATGHEAAATLPQGAELRRSHAVTTVAAAPAATVHAASSGAPRSRAPPLSTGI